MKPKKRKASRRDTQLPRYDAYALESRKQREARHAKPRNKEEAEQFYVYLIEHHYLPTVAFALAYKDFFSPMQMRESLKYLAWYEHGKGQRSFQPGLEPKRPKAKKSWLDRLIG